MVRIIGMTVCAVGLTLMAAACGDDTSRAVAQHETQSQATTTVTSIAVIGSTSTTTSTASVALPPEPSFRTLFAQLPYDVELVGFDEARGRSFVDSRIGEGPPARRYVSSQRLALELVDDGLGDRAEEQHAVVWGSLKSFDVYWNGHGITDVLTIGSDDDALRGRTAVRLDVGFEGGSLLFEDATDQPGPNWTNVLRQFQFHPGPEQDWVYEFDAPIVLSFISNDVIIVGTGDVEEPWNDTPRTVHVLDSHGQLIRSMPAPDGLVWIQPPPRELRAAPHPCDHQNFLYPGGLGWVLGDTEQTISACRNGELISTAPWGGGMGEFFISMDSNHDGIEEVFVGGTSVAGGGGTAYSLIGNELRPILTDAGHLGVQSGDVGVLAEYGCKDGMLVQVDLTTSGTTAIAARTFYEVTRDRAKVVNTEVIEWRLDEPIVESFALWEVWEAGPPLTDDLSDCTVSPSFERVLAARPDGTLLLNSTSTLPTGGFCGEEMPLVTWKDGVAKDAGRVHGIPRSAAFSSQDGSLVITVLCDGEAQSIATSWDGEWYGISNATPERVVHADATLALAGLPELNLELGERPPNDCDVNHQVRPFLLTADGSTSESWTLPSGEPTTADQIEPGTFVSTPDGRFAFIDRFTCTHEGPQKSVVAGTFDTTTGELLSMGRVELPDDFRTTRFDWGIDYPDTLAVSESGEIMAWLGIGTEVKAVVLSS